MLDLSCRKKDGKYFVVTDRWQKFTEVALSPQILDELAEYCDEFLIHGVDVEGKGAGMDDGLVRMLGEWDGIRLHMPVALDHRKIWNGLKKRAGERLILRSEVHWIYLVERFPMNIAKL